MISQFDAERVPVSLGIALDTSGSMYGDRIAAARAALDRFLFDLLGPRDELFLYRFDAQPHLVQPWTSDRPAVSRALGAVQPRGGTALYDTVAEAVPMAQTGSHPKKAVVVISDGDDTSSRTPLTELRELIRRTEVLVYAIGIDASGIEPAPGRPLDAPTAGRKAPVPSPFPGHPPAHAAPGARPTRSASTGRSALPSRGEALRAITDESGGRTEMIYSSRDLAPATAGIADELSRQYFLGYVSSLPHDGRWHTIDVQVRKGAFRVRARSGFVAN